MEGGDTLGIPRLGGDNDNESLYQPDNRPVNAPGLNEGSSKQAAPAVDLQLASAPHKYPFRPPAKAEKSPILKEEKMQEEWKSLKTLTSRKSH